MKVPLSEFISGSELPVEIYSEVMGTLVSIGHKGDKVLIQDLVRRLPGGVDYLTIHLQEYPNYFNRALAIAQLIIGRKEIDLAQRQEMVVKAMSNIITEAKTFGIRNHFFKNLKNLSAQIISISVSNANVDNLLKSLSKISTSLSRHSVAIATVSVFVGVRLKWTNALALEKLVLGSLLHDIGEITLPLELTSRPIDQLTPQEFEKFQGHCNAGMQLLRGFSVVSEEILEIISQHHERYDGSGYPRQLKQIAISPFARVVSLAEVFCELACENQSSNSIQALQTIKTSYRGVFWQEAVDALESLLSPKKDAEAQSIGVREAA